MTGKFSKNYLKMDVSYELSYLSYLGLNGIPKTDCELTTLVKPAKLVCLTMYR